MKNRLLKISALFSCLLMGMSWLGFTKISATPPAGYYLVWSDEFDGNSLDLSKWYYFNQVSQNATDVYGAMVETNGYLTINTWTTNGVNYSGIIGSQIRTFYGYYESSIKWGDSNAMWSAFWLESPNEGQFIGDPSASGAEMDIAEHRYVDVSNTNVIKDSVQQTVHWDGYGSFEQTVTPLQVGTGLSTGFHTYGFTWTPSVYVMAIDDVPYLNTTQGHSDRSEVIQFSSQSQTPSWSGSQPAAGYGNLTQNNPQMVIDYVRYYVPSNMVFWTGASSADWSDGSNYLYNMQATATNDVIFNFLTAANFNINFSAPSTVHTLTIQETSPITFSGNALTVTAGIDLVSAINDVVINAPLVVGADQTWKAGPGRTLTINGPLGGSGNLLLAGYGNVAFAGSNLWTGSATVSKGALVLYQPLTNSLFISGIGTAVEGAGGVMAGPVQISGGTLTANLGTPLLLSNSLSIVPGGSVTVGINPPAGTNAQILGLTSVNYGGTLVLASAGGNYSPGQVYKLFAASNYTGNFSAISPTIPGYEMVWDLSGLTNDGSIRVVATVPVATTNIYESRSGNTSTGVNNSVFAYSGFSATPSSVKSTAAGLSTGSSSRFASTFSPAPAFSVTPTLLVGPTYSVAITFGKSTTGNQMEVTNLVVAPSVSGVSASTLPATTAAYAAGPGQLTNNQWITVGTITPNTQNPTIGFTYVSGTAPNRWYVDAVKFTSILPSPGTLSSLMQNLTNMVVNWSGNFTLQGATNIAGPWSDLPGPVVVGPYTNAIGVGQQFFRLRK